MNSLNTLYFPGTDIQSIRHFPLFLLFRKIHILQPVEEEPSKTGKESSNNFIKSGFCQVHTPAPLGKSRERFQHLMRDITNRKDDYAAQLSSLTLATMSQFADKNVLSEREIINSIITPPHMLEKNAQEKREAKLWQVRLVLAIAELLDREEEEIAVHLAQSEDDENTLFKELHGEENSLEEENPFAEIARMKQKFSTAHPQSRKNRFNCWKTLFFESDRQESDMLLTPFPDCGSFLLDEYENISGYSAPLVTTLLLPAFIGWNPDEVCKTALAFHAQHTTLLTEIEAELSRIITGKGNGSPCSTDKPTVADLTSRWNKTVDASYPVKKYGRISVKIFNLQGISCYSLLHKDRTFPGTSNCIVINLFS